MMGLLPESFDRIEHKLWEHNVVMIFEWKNNIIFKNKNVIFTKNLVNTCTQYTDVLYLYFIQSNIQILSISEYW
jgi:hypothetical protein